MVARVSRWHSPKLRVLIGVLVAISPPVFAGSASSSLSVSASVINNCTISANSLAFGSYDPIVANASTPLNGTGTVTITCTKGATTTIGLDLGSNYSGSTRRMVSGGTYLTYEIYQDSCRASSAMLPFTTRFVGSRKMGIPIFVRMRTPASRPCPPGFSIGGSSSTKMR